jgi:hypothetical protein
MELNSDIDVEKIETSSKFLLTQAESIMETYPTRYYPQIDVKVAKKLDLLYKQYKDKLPPGMFLKTEVKDQSVAYKWMSTTDVDRLNRALYPD